MTKLLEKAFEEAAAFPAVDQDAFAWWLLDELGCKGDHEDCRRRETPKGVRTDLLQKAYTEASKLPDAAQDVAAAHLLEDIDSERRWAALFAKSGDLLERMAAEALANHKAGRTQPLDPDTL
jgi:hypothetical protein